LMDSILTCAGAIVNYPDSERGWKPFAINEGRKLLHQENIDAIISSSPPVTGHIVARELKGTYGTPWLADSRDLWSQNHNYSYGPLRKLIDRRLELKTLSSADALVSVSQPWADKLGTLHKDKTTYTITNGFDPETMNMAPVNLTAKFTITYTGTIYTGKQDPGKLFSALKTLITDGVIDPNDIEVRFYGSEAESFDKGVQGYGLSGIVRHHGLVSRETTAEKQRESWLLLLLDWEDPREKGVYPGKIFEYLAARRPVLATGGVAGNVVEVLLNETKAGIHALTVEDVKKTLEYLYKEYKLKGEIAYAAEESEVVKYTYREMARRFADILDHCLGTARTKGSTESSSAYTGVTRRKGFRV